MRTATKVHVLWQDIQAGVPPGAPVGDQYPESDVDSYHDDMQDYQDSIHTYQDGEEPGP